MQFGVKSAFRVAVSCGRFALYRRLHFALKMLLGWPGGIWAESWSIPGWAHFEGTGPIAHWTLAQCAWIFLFTCTVILWSLHTAFWIYIWPTTAMVRSTVERSRTGMYRSRRLPECFTFTNLTPIYNPNMWLIVRAMELQRANRVCGAARHDNHRAGDDCLPTPNPALSISHEAIIVFRALSVKILPGESRLPTLSIQGPRMLAVAAGQCRVHRGRTAKMRCFADLESAVTAQNDESKGSLHSSYSRLLNVKKLIAEKLNT